MNMFRTFMELDKLNETISIKESYDNFGDRQELIDKIKTLGRRYRFSKYSDEQLFNIWKKEFSKEAAKKAEEAAFRDYYMSKVEKPVCIECGRVLTDGGYCPVCDDGAEDLDEGIFDCPPAGSNWVTATGTPVKVTSPSALNNLTQATQTTNQTANVATNGQIVTIVYDPKAHKLRARADDGIHGPANVAFPNNLRNQTGQQYRVGQLVWNGKNYRVVGSITPLNSVATTQNIDENINKENYKMNFQTILEELDKIYEELPAEEAKKDGEDITTEEEVTEACDKTLTEDADEEVLIDDEPIIDDEVAEEEIPVEDAQLVLECAKCGALVIKPDSDVKVDEETDLANVDEACQYCEEAEGYKILGNLVVSEAPAEEPKAEEVADEEMVEEALEKEKEAVSEETAVEETAKSTEE